MTLSDKYENNDNARQRSNREQTRADLRADIASLYVAYTAQTIIKTDKMVFRWLDMLSLSEFVQARHFVLNTEAITDGLFRDIFQYYRHKDAII